MNNFESRRRASASSALPVDRTPESAGAIARRRVSPKYIEVRCSHCGGRGYHVKRELGWLEWCVVVLACVVAALAIVGLTS